MAYRIEFADRAARDLEALMWKGTLRIRSGLALVQTAWRRRSTRFATCPDRCPMAPEARKLRRELRHLLYGKKPHVYRVIYEVDERRQTVWVLTVRHGARRRLKASDVQVSRGASSKPEILQQLQNHRPREFISPVVSHLMK